MKMIYQKKNSLTGVVGWCIAALLLLNVCLFGADPLDELYNRCKYKSFGELQGEYNTVVGYHDDLRAKVYLTMPKSITDLFGTEDDAWCEQRQAAWAMASAIQDREALWEIVLLEYLRCNAIKEKSLDGSP
jgi:hypothetical protein